uniref:Late expression factor 5 n=1 Tax=Nesodiprion zhejiangensis nucleopolyhedrovirus TaxID=3135970 RepID=A0AAN0N6M3_9BACU
MPPCSETTLKDIEELFLKFRRKKKWEDLISYLKYKQPKCVKTFNLTGTGHKYHAMWAYNPITDKREKKQISLDVMKIQELHRITNNNSKLYVEIRKIMTDDHRCPCEEIKNYMQQIAEYKNNRSNKVFNTPPTKIVPNALEKILKNFTINLMIDKKPKKKIAKSTHTIKHPPVLNIDYEHTLEFAGQTTVKEICKHASLGDTIEIQNRSFDEMVNLYTTCIQCKQMYKIQ